MMTRMNVDTMFLAKSLRLYLDNVPFVSLVDPERKTVNVLPLNSLEP